MAKTKSKPVSRKKIKNTVQNDSTWFDPTQFGLTNTGIQLAQTDTLFRNLRTYLGSNLRQLLSQAYVEIGLIKTVVDVPVDDGLRGGVDIKTKELEPDQLEELKSEMEREEDLHVLADALKWTRLFGGGAVIILTDQNYEDPLDIDAIGEDSLLAFRAVDMWELFWDKQGTEGYDTSLQEHTFEHYSYYGKKLHKSRVLKMKGLTPPSFIRPRLRGWGLSIIETLIAPLNQYLKSNELIFEVLDEFKLDIYKIKGLASTLLSPTGQAKVSSRIQHANIQKNFQNAITMDAEDDYLQKELSFTGISETMIGIRMGIACALRMPISKIFGVSSTGFSSGEDDIENYNAMVESEVRQKCKRDITRMVEIRCQKKFGFIPSDIQVAFKPLRILSSEQEENVKTQKFNRLLAAKTANEISTLEFKDACNKDNLLGIQIDTSIESLDTEEKPSEEPEKEVKAPAEVKKPSTQAPEAKT